MQTNYNQLFNWHLSGFEIDLTKAVNKDHIDDLKSFRQKKTAF